MTRWAPWEVEVRSRFAAREHPPGFWIALWVVTVVVEALDGHLRVTSPPGHGTTVVAELPCG